MNRLFSAALLMSFVAVACSSPREKRSTIEFGQTDSIHSEILKENRKFFVYVPNSDGKSPYTPHRYPILYVLDGEDHFLPIVAMVRRMSETLVIPEMIVVGIPNTDRSRDLTTSRSQELPGSTKKLEWLKTTGGAENFTLFLEKELIPHIEKNYPTAPYKILAGHSFGGLFAMNAVLNHKAMFNSYIVMDPSMWWDKQKLLHHADTVLHRDRFDQKSIFLSVANTMKFGMDTLMLKTDTAAQSLHIRSIISLARQLKSNAANGLRSQWKYYDKDDHGSVTLISGYDALRFIFDYFPPRLDDQNMTAAGISDHFKMISAKLGYDVLPYESIVDQIAEGLTYSDPKKAVPVYEMNTTNYPKSAKAFSGLGNGYLQAGDTAKAIGALEKSLELKELPGIRDRLKGLKKK